MTPSQTMRLAGIKASLKVRGVSLTLHQGGTNNFYYFTALIEDLAPSTDQYLLKTELRAESLVSVLRSDLDALAAFPQPVFVRIGDWFLPNMGTPDRSYRITELGPRPSDILQSFRCETVRL